MEHIKYLKKIRDDLKKCLKKYKDDADWPYLDKLLYNLCELRPSHNNIKDILPKVVAIDRLYNAMLYRKGVKYINVARKLKASNIDNLLDGIGRKSLSLKNVEDASKILEEVSGFGNPRAKRTFVVFASKYLHFHKPKMFPMIDSFAQKALKKISRKIGLHFNDCECESRYECFCRQLLELEQTLKKVTKRRFSLADFDKLLYGKRSLIPQRRT